MLKINDYQMLDILSFAHRYCGRTMVHADNNDVINWLSKRLINVVYVALKYHAIRHNSIAESETSSYAMICLV